MKSEFDQGRHAEEVTTGRGQGTGLNVSVQGTIQGDASSSTHEIESLQECYVAMRMARAVDEMEIELVARGGLLSGVGRWPRRNGHAAPVPDPD